MGYDPITWRTVQGPSLAEASRPLESAQRMLASGFGTLDDALKQQYAIDEQNYKVQKENNTNAFLNQLYAANGPEGFKALQDSGQLQQMLAGFGAQIDQAKAREAMDTRMGTLQARDKATTEYNNFTTDERQRPVVQEILSLAALGKRDEALALKAANPDLRLPADLTKAIVSGERDLSRWKFEEAKQPLTLENMRLDNSGKGMQNAISSINLDKSKMEFKDLKQLRSIEEQTAAAVQQFQQTKDVIGRNMGVIAKAANLPVDARGMPAFSLYTDDDLAAFNKAAASNRQVKVPTAEEFMGGDTAVANAFMNKLSESGQFDARLLKKARDGIRSSFDSNANGTLVGNDAFNRNVGQAQQQVWLNEVKDKNWSAPGAPDVSKAYNTLAEEVPDLMDKNTGYNSHQDVADMQKLIYDMANKGIETSPGSGKYVTPSIHDMRHAIRTADGGLFRDAKRAENARKILEELVQTEPIKKRIADAEKATKVQRSIFTRDALGNQKGLLP